VRSPGTRLLTTSYDRSKQTYARERKLLLRKVAAVQRHEAQVGVRVGLEQAAPRWAVHRTSAGTVVGGVPEAALRAQP